LTPGFGEIGFGEIGFGETGFGEIGFGETGFGEIVGNLRSVWQYYKDVLISNRYCYSYHLISIHNGTVGYNTNEYLNQMN
jgi:hypothetical protein